MAADTSSRKKRKTFGDLLKWSEGRLDDKEVLDRWFKTNSNFSGTRENFLGVWAFDCKNVDWNDFERALDEYPELASIEEEADPLPVPILFHCFRAHDRPVPASVVKKMVEINPGLLEKFFIVGDACFEKKPIGSSVLQEYLEVPFWKTSFDVCRVLVESKPDLLLYREKNQWNGWDMSGRDTLLQHFPEEGKELCDTLEASGKVDFSERNIQAVNQRRLEELYPDERLERETLSSDSAEDTDSNNEEANEEESEETSATEELTFSSESSQEEGLNDALGEPDSNT